MYRTASPRIRSTWSQAFSTKHTGIAYLTDEIRRRPNLTIRGRVEVDRLLISRGATGVVCVDGTSHHAEEVILSAATYGIAAILMRAGIGPADDRVRALVADAKWDTAPRSASWRGLTTAPISTGGQWSSRCGWKGS